VAEPKICVIAVAAEERASRGATSPGIAHIPATSHGGKSMIATKIAKEMTPEAACTMHSHYLLMINTDAERCPICGRKLWRSPPQKCSRHGVWHCPECFSEDDLQALRAFKLHEEDEDDEGEED
jgi:predicted RNA-binding Zn-ribbon protein involved in translation (DUF1610 family)